MSTRTNYGLMLEQGRAQAAKATTAMGEIDAWESVVAQHIQVLEDNWRPTQGLLRLLRRHHENQVAARAN